MINFVTSVAVIAVILLVVIFLTGYVQDCGKNRRY